MNESRYSRNRIYITEEEQVLIANCKVVLGGAGIGSIIAECALRSGFENIHIIDGDKVELSNLNRQNYTTNDIGRYKAEVMFERLMSINPEANINFSTEYLTSDNIEEQLDNARIAVNALDFTSEVPFAFDDFCISRHIPVLHPYNLGWAGFVTIVSNEESCLKQIQRGGYNIPEQSESNNLYMKQNSPITQHPYYSDWVSSEIIVSNEESCLKQMQKEDYHGFELKMGKHITTSLAKMNRRQEWLENVIKEVESEKERLSPPQLSIASWITAGLCTDILFNIATGKTVKLFPEFYYSSTRQY